MHITKEIVMCKSMSGKSSFFLFLLQTIITVERMNLVALYIDQG